jgi:hypothetical protein
MRFSIRYGVFKPLLSLFGLGPRFSYAELSEDGLKVRMGWGFYASIPRSSITGAERSPGPVSGIGVHGWRGRWLVNGAAAGLVTINVEPATRAWVLGVPVTLRMLRVSLEDPDALLAALQ